MSDDTPNQLRAIASSSEYIPIGMVAAASSQLDSTQAQVMAILPDTSQHREPLNGMIAAAKESLDHAVGALNELEKAIHDAADGHARG